MKKCNINYLLDIYISYETMQQQRKKLSKTFNLINSCPSLSVSAVA